MKKFNRSIAILLGISFLQMSIFCTETRANRKQILFGSNLIQAEVKESGQHGVSIQSLLEKAQKFENQGDFNSVMPYYDSAISIAIEKNDQLMLNNLKRKKGTAFMFYGQFDSAKVYFIPVEEYASQKGIDSLLAHVQVNLGYLANLEGEMQDCLDYYSSALELYTNNNDTMGISSVMNNYCIYYEGISEYDEALEYALKNISSLAKFQDSRQYISSLISLGNVYERLEEYDTALAVYEQCYDLSLKKNYPGYVKSSLVNRGIIYYRQQKYTEAAVEFERAISYSQKIGDMGSLTSLYSNIGLIYRNQGKLDLALQSYMKALQIASENNYEEMLTSIYNNLGVLYKKKKEYSKAQEYYNKSLVLAKKRHQKAGIVRTYGNLASLNEEAGEYKKAFSFLTEANNWQDSVLNEEKVRAIEDMKAKYEKEKNMAQIKSLQDENKINELEKKSIRTERNSALGISAFVVFLLLLILYFFRMKARKNRIIDSQRIQQLEGEKKLLAAQSVIVGQERERKRIAQELHDGIGVLLSTASLHFSVVSKTSKDIKTIEMLDKAEQLLKQAGGEVRKISQNMMPVVLSKFGLLEALEDMFEKLDEFDELDVITSFSGINERLPENTEIMLYRIIQEMTNNTLKHANAKNIEFSYNKGKGVILIDYKDDGVGFDFEKLPHNTSLGVFGIQSRIDFLKGKVKIESGIGKGTYYHVSIPVKNLDS